MGGQVRGQGVMRDGKAGLVGQGVVAGRMHGHGLHRGHGRVHNDAFATLSACDRSPGHLIV